MRGSIWEMLIDMSVRYNLSCRELGVGVQLRRPELRSHQCVDSERGPSHPGRAGPKKPGKRVEKAEKGRHSYTS